MILMRNIIREGHPSLTTPSSNVILPLSPADIKLAKDLMEFVQNSQNDELAKKYKLRPAVGLAAPQVNKLIRMFAMHCQDFEGNLYSYVMINPEITKHSKEETYLPTGEGCLSVDRPTTGYTPRYYAIMVRGYYFDFETETAKPIELTLQGYPSIVFQHEFDHLNGVMFTSKLYPKLPQCFPLFELNEEDEETPEAE
ncbi:MAG TPA: peptide deformylase [Acholeplasma sp.]|jgi:peptide deformylase